MSDKHQLRWTKGLKYETYMGFVQASVLNFAFFF